MLSNVATIELLGTTIKLLSKEKESEISMANFRVTTIARLWQQPT